MPKTGTKSTSKGVVKLTPKQEKFCFVYIETGNASEAYRQAYNAEKMKPKTIRIKANELLNNGNITVTLEELKKEHKQRHNITVDDLLDELEENRRAALSAATPQAAAATSATMGKAKLLGLDKQVVDVTSSDGSLNIGKSLRELFSNDTEA